MSALAPTDEAVRARAPQEFDSRDCSQPGCPGEADGDDGLCHAHRLAAQAPAPLPALTDPVGLELHPQADVETWTTVLRRVATVDVAVQFWIGDLLVYGGIDEQVKYDRAEEMLGERYARSTLVRLAMVARALDRPRRRRQLHWSHHDVVVPLPPAEQDRWLQTAIDERLSVHRLREAIQDERNGRRERAGAPAQELVPTTPPYREIRPTRPVVLVARRRIYTTLSANEQQAERWSAAAESRGWTFARLVREALDRFVAEA